MKITFKGNPVTLKSAPLRVGDHMPDVTLMDQELNPVRVSELEGIKLFATVPSLDTGVCDLEMKRFNEKAAELPDVQVFAVSMDLPFAQARWCGGLDHVKVKTLSDYQRRNFGSSTGTLIEELLLLTRAVFIVDRENVVVYSEYVPEITNHPEYEKIFASLEKLSSGK